MDKYILALDKSKILLFPHPCINVNVCLYSRDVQIGDVVTVGECRPLSKTVRFNVVKVTKQAGGRKSFAKF